MAYGKRAPTQRTLQQFENNRVSKVVHRTEVKVLGTLDPKTPLGAGMLVGDTERAMSGKVSTCPSCNTPRKGDFTLERTGVCEVCTRDLPK